MPILSPTYHFGSKNHKLTCQVTLSLTFVIFVDMDHAIRYPCITIQETYFLIVYEEKKEPLSVENDSLDLLKYHITRGKINNNIL